MSAPVLVVAIPEQVSYVTDAVTIDMVLDSAWADVDELTRAARDPLELGVLGAISVVHARTLASRLHDVGILPNIEPSLVAPRDAWALKELLQKSSGGEVLARGLVTAGLEALWLPSCLSNGEARVALRMFLSRIEPRRRLGAYAGLVAERPQLGVLGDNPNQAEVDLVLRVVSELENAVAIRIEGREPRVVGRLESGRGHGRLAAGQVRRTECLSGSSEWHVAIADSACPHLGVVDVMGDRAAMSTATGLAASPEAARERALGEAFERFATGDVRVSRLVRLAAVNLKDDWLDPRHVIEYSSEQRGRNNLGEFSADAPEWWVDGYWANNGNQVWVPAALVFSPFQPLPSWLHPGAGTSNGAAAHPDLGEAILRGWLEVVERDAFLRVWAAGRPPQRVASSDPEILSLLAIARSMSRQVEPLLFPSPLDVSVLGVAAVRETGGLMVGAAAGDPKEALIKALLEVALHLQFPLEERSQPSKVVEPKDHGGLYEVPKFAATALWLFDGEAVVQLETLPGRPSSPRARVAVVELASPDIVPLNVVKTVCPGLIPMTFGWDSEPLGIPDLAAAFARRGVDLSEPLTPHPFA